MGPCPHRQIYPPPLPYPVEVAAWDVLFWVTCTVLVVAGASKLSEPSGTAAALGALGIPGRDAAARALGAVEVGLGLGGLAVGGRVIAAGVAVAYAFFAVVVLVARRRGLASCGCFGARSAPPSPVHVAVNAVSAAVAAVAAVARPVPVADALAAVPWPTAAAALGLVVLVTALVVVLDTVAADVVEATAALRAQTIAAKEDR